MMKNRYRTKIKAVILHRKAGMRLKEACRRAGIGYSTFRKYATIGQKRLFDHYKPYHKTLKKVSIEKIHATVQDIRRGLTIKEACERHRLSLNTFYKYRRRN